LLYGKGIQVDIEICGKESLGCKENLNIEIRLKEDNEKGFKCKWSVLKF
jgi:hypothetical protein